LVAKTLVANVSYQFRDQFIIETVPAENKQDMLDTSITLLWFSISSVGFLPVDTCCSWVSRCDWFGPERGYLQKGLWSSS